LVLQEIETQGRKRGKTRWPTGPRRRQRKGMSMKGMGRAFSRKEMNLLQEREWKKRKY